MIGFKNVTSCDPRMPMYHTRMKSGPVSHKRQSFVRLSERLLAAQDEHLLRVLGR